MAHQDDFEFNAGGLFSILKTHYKQEIKIKILTSTRGASGHHEMVLEETFRRREREAQASATLIGAEYECLKQLDGSHLPGQVFIDHNLLGGLWNAIRKFEPDYIFCPPVIDNPMAGIHIDHYNTAWAVRMVAYQLSVPHAYPATFHPINQRVTYPVIINVHDSYAGGGEFDFCIDISSVYETKEKMALCHESQVFEWLPWNSGEAFPITKEDFQKKFKKRHQILNEFHGFQDSVPREFFRLTNWGNNVSLEEVKRTLLISDANLQ